VPKLDIIFIEPKNMYFSPYFSGNFFCLCVIQKYNVPLQNLLVKKIYIIPPIDGYGKYIRLYINEEGKITN